MVYDLPACNITTMKLLHTLFPCLVMGTILVSCSHDNESRVLAFNCGAETDTSIAILNWRIVEEKVLPNGQDTLVPLSNATLSLEKSGHTFTVDSLGAFLMYLETKATHTFTVSKAGYQPLKIEGFFAEKETQAEISIVLAKGITERTGRVTACKIAY